MKILLCHQNGSMCGAAIAAEGEGALVAELLTAQGHRVVQHLTACWRGQAARASLAEILERERPEVVHFLGLASLVPRRLCRAIHAAGGVVVQSFADFRPLCKQGGFRRRGQPCEQCLERRWAWPALLHGCGAAGSSPVSALAGLRESLRCARTSADGVDRYIVPSNYARWKYIVGGLPAARVAVKPPCTSLSDSPGDGAAGHALYAGPLTEECGIPLLLRAWRELGTRIALRVVGDGPLAGMVRQAGSPVAWCSSDVAPLATMLGEAAFLVTTRLDEEVGPALVVESLARATPVLAPRRGPLLEWIDDRRTGLLFEPGDATDLARKVLWLLDHPEHWERMRTAARDHFVGHFSPAVGYARLLRIYETALGPRVGQAVCTSPRRKRA